MSSKGTTARQHRELDLTDHMSRELRLCVHEFGLTIVEHLMKHGVTSPSAIRELVCVIWEGARQPAQSTLKGNSHHFARGALARLDWALIQASSPIGAVGLVRHLADKSFVLVPGSPSGSMIEASMHAIDGMPLMSKREKHQRRLMAAIRAAADELKRDAKAEAV